MSCLALLFPGLLALPFSLPQNPNRNVVDVGGRQEGPAVIGTQPKDSLFSIPGEPGFKIRLLSLSTKFDPGQASVIERPAVANLVGPYFSVAATAVSEGQAPPGWALGWMQTVEQRAVRQVYEDGEVRFEMPRTPILDTGNQWGPWYGPDDGFANIEAQPLQIALDDNPSLRNIPWSSPTGGALKELIRDQLFKTYLVAWSKSRNKVFALCSVSWEFSWGYSVDLSRPLGGRVLPRSDTGNAITLKTIEWLPRLDISMLSTPYGNEAQKRIWQARKDSS